MPNPELEEVADMQVGEPRRIYRVEPLRTPVPAEPKQRPLRPRPEPQPKTAALR